MSHHMILIVDDEPDTIELIKAVFKRRGYGVLGCTDGHDGLRLARAHLPAIILIDLMLPGLNGFEICRRLRDDPSTAYIPRVIVSACDSLDDQVKALAAGADRYMVKPVSMKALIELVEDLIGRPYSAVDMN